MIADDWIQKLNLQPHPEGGFYRETWRSDLNLPADAIPHGNPRSAGTSIYFLLPSGVRSNWHRVASDELWIFQFGDPLDLQMGQPDDFETLVLGPAGQMQSVVPANAWQAAESRGGNHGYTLVCCVVVPGFDFEDFEMI